MSKKRVIKSMKAIYRSITVICALGVFTLLGVQTLAEDRSSGDELAGSSPIIHLAQEDSGEAAEEDPKEQEAKEKEEEEPRPRSAAPERFIPTEKISADSAVSFPVDI